MAGIRISQFVSLACACSRREADALIKHGKVKINEKPATFGMEVQPSDHVTLDEALLRLSQKEVYILFNKPRGVTCTAESHIQNNIIDYIQYPERIFPVGRLDKDSEGLMLMTNDGMTANRLLQASYKEEKDYIVTVNRELTDDFLNKLRKGVRIYNPRKKEYTVTRKCEVERLTANQFKITLTQGLNRQIRRMCRASQYTVTKLERIRFKALTLTGLPRGEWRHLTDSEIKRIKQPKTD